MIKCISRVVCLRACSKYPPPPSLTISYSSSNCRFGACCECEAQKFRIKCFMARPESPFWIVASHRVTFVMFFTVSYAFNLNYITAQHSPPLSLYLSLLICRINFTKRFQSKWISCPAKAKVSVCCCCMYQKVFENSLLPFSSTLGTL